jgi:hypothetical protein
MSLALVLIFIDSKLQVMVIPYRIEIPGIHFQDLNTEHYVIEGTISIKN